MTDLSGTRLGQYEILSLIGQGGMASVYRARQLNIDRDVAIKVIRAHPAEAESLRGRFDREARTVAQLNHPYILKVFDYGQQGEVLYLVMELQTGGSLASLVARGPLSLEQSERLLNQIASALDYAHRRGIVHRDLKPHNVLLNTEGDAILTDFGIAKLLQSDSNFTQTGMVMGTPAYMAPEQWQGLPVDSRADIYALGVMLFEMLAGKPPFQAESPFTYMHKHVNEPPPRISSVRAEVPPEVEVVLLRALAKDPNSRYGSASELAEAFQQARSGKSVSSGSFRGSGSGSMSMGASSLDNDRTAPIPTGTNRGSSSAGFQESSASQAGFRSEAISLPPTRPARSRSLVIGIAAVAVIAVVAIGLLLLNRNNNDTATTPTGAAVAADSSETPGAIADAPTATSPDEVPTTTPSQVATQTPDLPATATQELQLTNAAAAESTVDAATAGARVTSAFQTAEAAFQIGLTETATNWTKTPTSTNTHTPVPTDTPTHTQTFTFTPSNTPTDTPTATLTPSATFTFTPSPTLTPTFTFTPSSTPTPTLLPTPMERTNQVGTVQVWVPEGCFLRGTDPAIDELSQPDERPQQWACFSVGFWIDKYEVSNAAYQPFIDAGGYTNQAYWSPEGWQWLQANNITGPFSYPQSSDPNQPRVGVSWYEAEAYARWIGAALPTEAQWEFAARGPASWTYPWGNTFEAGRANVEGGLERNAPVDSFPEGQSWVSAYQMCGNVWEWTADWYARNAYAEAGAIDPVGPATGEFKVQRGGSWFFNRDDARSGNRASLGPHERYESIGFRLVWTE